MGTNQELVSLTDELDLLAAFIYDPLHIGSFVDDITPRVKSACARGRSPAVSSRYGSRSQARLSEYLFVRRALREFVP